MVRCTRFMGKHKWSIWELSYGAPENKPDGTIRRQKNQTRECKVCHFTVVEWLPSWQICEKVEQETE